MPELAVGYVSLVAETSKIPPAIKKALNQGDSQASAAGRSMGDRMSSALGGALKKGAAAAGAAGIAAAGVAMTKGFQRLQAIDDAKGKLEGLGHTTASTAKIMDSAMASVKGTAYGLGDAATIAAGAVAAGVKPGQDLTKYLSMTADAASIAGVELGEMGSILNTVQTSGSAMNDSLDQMAERGIPIFQWLAEEMGVTAGEVQDLASKGEVSSDIFFKAIQKNIGGAAQAAGKTVRGSFSNMIAALGRLGAAAQAPSFARLPGTFTSITAAIDKVTPKVKDFAIAFDAKVFDEWAPKAREAFEAFKDTGILGDSKSAFVGLSEAAVALLPALGQIGGALAQASAALGVGTWQIFLATLNATAGVLNGVAPILNGIGNIMQAQPGLVMTALAAWMAFKTVPGLMTRLVTAVTPMSSALRSTTTAAATASSGFMGFVRANNAVVASSRSSFVEMGRFGSMISQVGSRVPVIGGMQSAFLGAAQSAERFGRTAGSWAAVRAGMNGVKSAAGSMVNALGGGLNVAMMGLTIAGGAMISSFQRQSQIMKEQDRAAQALADSHLQLGSAMRESRGEATDEVMSIANQRIDEYKTGVEAAARADGKWHEALFDLGAEFVTAGQFQDGLAASNDASAAAAQQQQQVYKQLGLTTEEVGKSVYGSTQSWNILANKLTAMGPAGIQVKSDLGQLRAEFMEQKNIAERITPGFKEMSDAMQLMGDKTASASEKLNALKTAMNALNPARSEAEAMSQWGDAVRAAAQAASGIDASAFDMKGKLDSSTEAGKSLKEALVGLADASAAAATSGADMKKVNAGNEDQFKALASATGKSVEEIRALYGSFGGKAVDIAVKLQGAGDTVQQLGSIKAAMDANPDLKVFKMEAKGSEGVQAALTKIGIEFAKTPDGKFIDIDLTGDAGVKLQNVIDIVDKVPDGKQVAVNAPGGQQVFDLLKAMNVKVTTDNSKIILTDAPNAGPVIDLLKQMGLEVRTNNGKTILVKVDDSDYVMKKDDWTRPGTKFIDVVTRVQPGYMGPGSSIGGQTVTPNANGSIVPARAYVDGGIQAAESFANGGLKEIAKPTRADIFAGRGDGTIFAEKETGGEAFIPLALSKRSRSTDILAAVAKMFGLELIPRDGSISGLLGGIAGGAVSKLLKSAGADGITRFADGGFNAKQLRELADGGHGASQPLTGAPYVWGGVNWGDCCLTWDAPVWGPHGVKPIGLIEAGDYVWSYVDGKIESHQVTAQWFSKRQDVFKVRTRHRSVTGSANHPFLRVVQTTPAKPRVGRRGWDPAEYGVEWARLDELRRGDLLVQPKSVHLDREVSNTLPSGREIGLNEAWLLGVILGDGNVSDTKVEICVYGDLRDRVRGVLSGMHLDASKTRAERDGIGSSDSDSHGIRAYSTQFARELDEAGFRKPAYEKSIPECVWSWDEDRQRAFLNGYCDADGHHPKDVAHHGERTYASSSRRLIEDVRYLHITLGDVVANVSTNKRSKPITINGKRVKNARPLHSISVRPAGETLVASVAATARPGIVAWIDRGDFTVAPVLGVTAMGEADTYDIEVASSANFIAGGVVVHNSGAVSAFARAAAGLAPFGGRMSTGSMGSDLPAIGFQRGAGKSGDMRVAYYNGGPGGGHAVGRLPDDTNVEMGGQNGGGMVGGPVGPDHPQFTDRWYLTVAQALDNAVGTLTLDSTTDTPSATTDTPSATTDTPTTTSTPDTVSKESTISGLVGDVVKTGVSGQIKDILDVFGVNDSPGALAAWAGLPVKDVTSGKSVDPKKLREAQDKVTDKEAALKIARTQLDEAKKNKKLKPSQLLAAQGKVDRLERELGQAKDDLKALEESGTTTTATITPGKKLRDPGTHRPKRGEDTGVGKLSSVDAIKNAFKGGLREAWRSGDQWSATDWIVNKESTWKPDAQNGKYWGLIQAGEDVYRAAGVDPKTTDPALQAKAFDKYVDGRYKTPVDAKAFHEANNWYDQGGIAPRKGLMLKNINTPERVLSPRQTSAFEQMVRRDFQSGIGTDVIVAKLDQLIKVVVAQGPNGVQPARDDRDFADKQRQKNRRLVAAGKGGRV